MSCPTCDHTMRAVSHDSPNEWTLFWCSRCGTLRWGEEDPPDVPALVHGCRQFRAALAGFGEPELTALWYTAGIAESINKPEDRS